jgi:hypothetical protein
MGLVHYIGSIWYINGDSPNKSNTEKVRSTKTGNTVSLVLVEPAGKRCAAWLIISTFPLGQQATTPYSSTAHPIVK